MSSQQIHSGLTMVVSPSNPNTAGAASACFHLPQGGAEVIVTFEGTTEMGNPFMVRQSYLPMEIHWGHSFVSIISKPEPGDTHYYVDMTRSEQLP